MLGTLQELVTAVSGNAASAVQLLKVDTDRDENQVMGGSGGASREGDKGEAALSQQRCHSGSGFVALKGHTIPG